MCCNRMGFDLKTWIGWKNAFWTFWILNRKGRKLHRFWWYVWGDTFIRRLKAKG